MESAGGDGGSGEEDGNEEVMPLILRRSIRRRRSPSPCHLCDSDIRGGGCNRNYHSSKRPRV